MNSDKNKRLMIVKSVFISVNLRSSVDKQLLVSVF